MRLFHSIISSSGGGLPSNIRSLFSFLWLGTISGSELVDVISGNNITVTGMDFSTTIPSTSTATLAMANVAALKTDDGFDGLWFTDAGAVNQVPVSYLIGNDYSRTIVKYEDSSPYNISWIGVLDDAVSLTSDQIDSLHLYFRLHIFWSGVFNNYGYLKDNRALQGYGYKQWLAEVNAASLTNPSETVKSSVNKLCLDLINYGVASGMDRCWNFMLNDSALVDGAGTISLFNSGETRLTFPVAPTYTASGFKGGSSSYANTQFNPSTQGTNYTLNNASRGLYKYSAGTPTAYIDGHASSAVNAITEAASSSLQRINGNSGGVGDTRPLGYFALDRSDASNHIGYKETASSSATAASSSLVNENITILRAAFGYGDAGISFYYLGRSFSAAEHLNIRLAFLAHKTRLGL